MNGFRHKHPLEVFLGRTRVAAGLLLLVFACGTSARLLYITTVPKVSLAVPDEMTALDSRYATLLPALPRDQTVCFLAEPGIPQEKAVVEWHSAEYGLAPKLLTPDSNCEFVVQLTSRGPCLRTRLGERCVVF